MLSQLRHMSQLNQLSQLPQGDQGDHVDHVDRNHWISSYPLLRVEPMNTKNQLRQRMCDQCEDFVLNALNARQRIDFHYCKHRRVLAQWRTEDFQIKDCMLQGPMSEGEVAMLFTDAMHSFAHQMAQMPRPEDSVN